MNPSPNELKLENEVFAYFGNAMAVNIEVDGKDKTLILAVQDDKVDGSGRHIYGYSVLSHEEGRENGVNEIHALDLVYPLGFESIDYIVDFTYILSDMWGEKIWFDPDSPMNEDRSFPLLKA